MMGRKRSSFQSSPPIAIPISSTPRVFVSSSFNDENDDVFENRSNTLSSNDNNASNGKKCCRRRLSARRPPSENLPNFAQTLFPDESKSTPFKNAKLSPDNGICVTNSPSRRLLQRRSLDSIFDLKVLGRGSFGSVVLGSWNGKRVAVKLICSRDRSDSATCELNARELSHENLVKIHGIFPASSVSSSSVSSSVSGSVTPGLSGSVTPDCVDGKLPFLENTLIVMEYVGKDNLKTLLDNRPEKFDVGFTRSCLVDVARALSYVHSKGLAHLDVKPENVFVTSQGVCKLGDFGCSKRVDGGSHEDEKRKRSSSILVGTSGYQAPEYLCQGSKPSFKCDVYSFGVLAWQVSVGKEAPFSGMHPHAVIYQVVTLQRRPDHKNPKLKTAFSSIYTKCWSQDPDSRPDMADVVKMLHQRHSPRLPSQNRTEERRRSMRI